MKMTQDEQQRRSNRLREDLEVLIEAHTIPMHAERDPDSRSTVVIAALLSLTAAEIIRLHDGSGLRPTARSIAALMRDVPLEHIITGALSRSDRAAWRRDNRPRETPSETWDMLLVNARVIAHNHDADTKLGQFARGFMAADAVFRFMDRCRK